MDVLENEEAWDLFSEIAGNSIADLDLHETARDIVYMCNGLRIAISCIASALKGKPRNAWEVSRTRLQYVHQNSISYQKQTFCSIHLSYDLLGDKEAQLFFCLCCLFPQDFNIPVEDLVLFAKGLQLFENADSMQQARDRVDGIIFKLKSSFFLLDGGESDFVKLHNFCREFGVFMSSKWIHPYVVRCENRMKKWPPEGKMYQRCRAISFMCKSIEQHLIGLKCPNLDLLQLTFGSDSAQLPNGIFEGVNNLKVLSLSIPSLSEPLKVLNRLRTLCIIESVLDNRYKKPHPKIGDLLGDEMKDLEVFSLSTARPYRDFPAEIGLLCNLRFLKFNPESVKYIPSGVLLKLTKLEELYLPVDFIGWGHKEEGGKRMNASLCELESLQLTAISIGLSNGMVLAEKLVKKLTRFHVFIGSHVSPEYEFGTCGNSKRSLEVFDVDADDFRVSWVSALVWKCESLRLKQVRNLKNIIT